MKPRLLTKTIVLYLFLSTPLLLVFPVNASCSNPSPLPAGYAAPCPVFSVSPASVSQTGTLILSATPQPGTDYIYTTAYYAKGSTWLPVQLSGNNAAPSYSSSPASGTLPTSILSTLTPGTNYVVLWDWLWDATAVCYKGPGLNQCNTGVWRLQTFNLTAAATVCTVCVNAGGSQYTDGSGQVWSADTGYTGGSTVISANTISGTADPTLYQSERYGMTQYAFTVPNGTYTVILKFAEYNLTGAGQRVFTVIANGVTVLSNFDIYAVAGGNNIAIDRQFTVNVSGGQVLLQFNPIVAQPKVDAIRISGAGSTYTYSQAVYGTYTYSQSAYTAGCTNCNNYYVSPTGSDSNPGTQGSPWKTIGHAVNSNTPTPLGTNGTIIHVAPGTYSVSRMVSGEDPLCASTGCSSYHVFIGKSGTAAQRLIVQCDAQFQCLIRPSDTAVPEGIVNVGECCTSSNPKGDYVDVIGFDIGGTASGADASHYTQAGLEMMGTYDRAIGNYIHHILKYTWNGAYGIYVGYSAARTPTGTYCQDACPTNSTPVSHGQQVIGNVIVDVGVPAGSGDLLSAVNIYAASPDEIIENNIIYNNPAVVTIQGCITANHWGTHSVISNNTLNCNDNGASVFAHMGDGPFDGHIGLSGMTYDNNVIIHSAANGYAFRESGAYTSGMYFGSNACDQPSCSVATGGSLLGTFVGTIPAIDPSTFFSSYNASNQYPKATINGFTINPNGTDYGLKAGSPGINVGTTTCVNGGIAPCTPSTDFDGKTRPQGSAIDIGAYEQ